MANNRMKRYARMALAANSGRGGNRGGNRGGGNMEMGYGRMEGGRMEMGYGGEMRNEMGNEMRGGMRGEMRNEMRGGMRGEMRNEMRSGMRNEMRSEGGRMNYGGESRFRDRRGRWHYDNGRFSPRNEMESMGGEMNYGAESRRRGRRARSDFDTETYAPWGPYGEDDEEDDGRAMNKIGFSVDGEMGYPWEFDREYRADAGYRPINEMERRMGTAMPGRGESSGGMKLDHEKAKEWVASMQNEDGSRGAHWTMEQTRQIQNQKGLASLDPMRFWVTMNMMYSDYCSVFEKAGISKPDLYADLAKAFLMDKDAHKDKLDRYWCYVVKR